MIHDGSSRLVRHIEIDGQIQRPDVAVHPYAAEEKVEEVGRDEDGDRKAVTNGKHSSNSELGWS